MATEPNPRNPEFGDVTIPEYSDVLPSTSAEVSKYSTAYDADMKTLLKSLSSKNITLSQWNAVVNQLGLTVADVRRSYDILLNVSENFDTRFKDTYAVVQDLANTVKAHVEKTNATRQDFDNHVSAFKAFEKGVKEHNEYSTGRFEEMDGHFQQFDQHLEDFEGATERFNQHVDASNTRFRLIEGRLSDTDDRVDAVTLIGSGYDMIITSETQFKALSLLYPLFDNERDLTRDEAATAFEAGTASLGKPSEAFKARRILVRGVSFTERHGYDDVRMHIFQPSIEYIKFEDCRWETEWWVSGARPTELSGKTQFRRAPGEHKLVIDGISISEQNVRDSYPTETDPNRYYYIGLRNMKAVINCSIDYPDDYKLQNGWTIKFTNQYFDYMSHCRGVAPWDGYNVSDCYITDRMRRCYNCTNIIAEPVLTPELDGGGNTILDGEGNPTFVIRPVPVEYSEQLVNFRGKFTFTNCKDIGATKTDVSNAASEAKTYTDTTISEAVSEAKAYTNTQINAIKTYDLVVSTIEELKNLESNTTAKSVLVKGITVSRYDYVHGFFDNTASEWKYFSKFVIPKNVKYIKFSESFSQSCSRVVIQGHEDCIIDGFPTVPSPYTSGKLYGNFVVLYNFKEAWNCRCRNIHQFDAEGNYVFVPGVNGISNVLIASPTITDYPVLAPANAKQNTKFVNCDLMLVDGASAVIDCRLHSCSTGAATPYIKHARIINGLSVSYIEKSKFSLENCSYISAVDAGNCAVTYINCPNISASTSYVDGKLASVPILDENSRIPSRYLPSYVDDVLEGYYWEDENGNYFGEALNIYDSIYSPESGKIYVDLNTGKTYRWSGTEYVEISASLALGDAEGMAFPGNRGLALEEKVGDGSKGLVKDVADVKQAVENEPNNRATAISDAIGDIGGKTVKAYVDGAIEDAKQYADDNDSDTVYDTEIEDMRTALTTLAARVTTLEQGSSSGGSGGGTTVVNSTYTNPKEVPKTLGGIVAGSTFNNVSFKNMFDKLLYPPDAITGFYFVNGSDVSVKDLQIKGTTVTLARAAVTVSRQSGDGTTLKITNSNGTVLGTTATNDTDSLHTYYLDIADITLSADATFSATLYDEAGNELSSRSMTFTYVDPVYVGTIGETTDFTADIITDGTTQLAAARYSKISHTYTLSANCPFIAFPASLPIPTITQGTWTHDWSGVYGTHEITIGEGDSAIEYIALKGGATTDTATYVFQF